MDSNPIIDAIEKYEAIRNQFLYRQMDTPILNSEELVSSRSDYHTWTKTKLANHNWKEDGF